MIKKERTPLEVWNYMGWFILALYLLFLVYPLGKILRESLVNDDGSFGFSQFHKFFSQSYYFETLLNSLKVSLATTAISLVIGIPLAYFYNMFEMKGRKFLQIVIILCSMSAPFIGAYSWILLLGRNGVITVFLRNLGINIPNIYGFSGILLALSSRLFPMVFLYVSGAMQSIDNSLLEASRNLGVSGPKMFFKVIIPLCMPSILASALIVFMRGLADFGTPLMIGEGYRTFPVEIYNQYVGETSVNYNFAAAISVIAIAITALVFLLQKWLTGKYRFTINAMHTIERRKPSKGFGIFIHIYAYLLVAISMMPQIYLIYCSFKKTSKSGALFLDGFSLNSYKVALSKMSSAIWNTLLIGVVAVAIVIVLALLVAYLVVRRPGAVSHSIDTLSMVPYVIPGSVVGIALIMGFNQRPLVLTGTFAIMIISLIIRRIPYTIRSSVAILGQIPISVEEAAVSLGVSKLKAFFKVTVPMMANGIVSGGLLSWVTIITELSSSIILYTAHTVTLTLSIYIFVSRGTDGPACAMATILTLFTIISLVLFMKFSKSKDITM